MSEVIPTENKSMYKGQDKDFGMYIAAPEGGMYDLTSCVLVFSVYDIIGGDPVITKSSAESGEIDINADQTNYKGQATLFIAAADTPDLSAGKYHYDIWLTDVASKKRPVLTGYFWISEVAPNIVNKIRIILDEGGEMRVYTEQNDLANPRATSELYLPRVRLLSIEGVWVGSDTEHTGTNYYTGGGFNSNTGRVWLGTALPDTQPVLVNYSWEAGIDEEAILWHLNASRLFIMEYSGVDFEYGKADTQRKKAAEAACIARSILGCILTINGANVAQMGYNYRLSELEIQTKLWGEGMIAEALFNVYIKDLTDWLLVLGFRVPLVIAKQTRHAGFYNLDTLLADRSVSSGDELS